MTGRCSQRAPGGGARDRILLYTLTPLGLTLFILGFLGSQLGFTVLPLDPHHIGTRLSGLVPAFLGLSRWT